MNRWIWLNLSFLIPFALIQISAWLIPYHYQVLVFYRAVVLEVTVPLLILSHVLAIATLTVASRIRNRWLTIVIVWFSFFVLFIGTFAFTSIFSISKSSSLGSVLFGLGYFIFLWSILVPVPICIAIIGLIVSRRRLNLQKMALVMFWTVIYCSTTWLWVVAGTTSYRTINQVMIKDHQIYLIDHGSLGGRKYLIYHCNSLGFFCNSFNFYDSYTIDSFNYWRDPVTNKIYIREGSNKIFLLDPAVERPD
jgi:hypothetical protein